MWLHALQQLSIKKLLNLIELLGYSVNIPILARSLSNAIHPVVGGFPVSPNCLPQIGELTTNNI
jgi:hypothetical protein